MIDNVKQLLFTITGLVVTALHVCFIVGAIACTVGFKLYVLGDDPAAIVSVAPKKR